jgi:hypothetical protein
MSHEKLAMALLTANMVREASERCSLSKGHIHRLKKDENFRKILRDRREALFSLGNNRAVAYRKRAFSILCEIAEDCAQAAGNRLSALKQILSIGNGAKIEELEDRLQTLEWRDHDQVHF